MSAIHPLLQPNTTDYIALTLLSLAGATYLSRGILWDQPDPYAYLLYERPQLKNSSSSTSSTTANAPSRNVAHKLTETNSNLVVFFGSQSGTAESLAHRLAREITLRFGQGTLTADLSDYDPASLAEIPEGKVAVFILSTYGESDPSDNAAEFWDWLHPTTNTSASPSLENGATKLLSNLRYVILGLGNSNYKYYNRVADVVAERLQNLGANAFLPVVRADDALGSTQEDFITWKDEALFPLFRESLGFSQVELVYRPTVTVTEHRDPDAEKAIMKGFFPGALTSSSSRGGPGSTGSVAVHEIPVMKTRQLFTSGSGRHCLHLELDLGGVPDVVYKTGDHLGVWASNPDEEVELLLRVLGREADGDDPISVSRAGDHQHLDNDGEKSDGALETSVMTIRALLRHYLEISAPVPRDTLATLATFAPTSAAKQFVIALAESKEAYAELMRRRYVTLARLLGYASEFSTGCGAEEGEKEEEGKVWADIPLSYLVETLPLMQPRYYSISSSSVVSPRKPSLTVLILSTPLVEDENVSVPGLASTYLLSLDAGREATSSTPTYTNTLLGRGERGRKKVLAHLCRSNFKLPRVASTPLILIAAGTGLAPLRGFLQERRQLRKLGKEVGNMILFFGCRCADDDFIYREELEEMQRFFGTEKLKLVLAYSRDPKLEKKYVQDRVVEEREEIADLLLNQGANLYICGRTAMAREVEKRVAAFLTQFKDWEGGERGVEEWVGGMKRRKKWQEDVWG